MVGEYTLEVREAAKELWVNAVKGHLSAKDDEKILLGLSDIRQMLRNSGGGSGTNAEALAKLTAFGLGDEIDKVKNLLDASDKDLADAFGLKINWDE